VLEQGVEQFKEFGQLIWWVLQLRWLFCLSGKDPAFTSTECEIHALAGIEQRHCWTLAALADGIVYTGTSNPPPKERNAQLSSMVTFRCPVWPLLLAHCSL